MRKRSFLYLLGVIGLVILISGCNAVEAQTSYQGQLTNSSGTPVSDGNYQMTFRLYKAEGDAIGSALWTESQTVQVINGLFNVTLGSATPIDTSIFAQKLWLGVEVESDGEMTPRQQLTGAPYAMSLVAGSLVQGTINNDDTLPGSLNVYNAGNGYGIAVGALGEAGIAVDGSDIGQNGLLIDNVPHGAIITGTNGTGLQVFGFGGVANDYYGVRGDSEEGDGVFGWGYGADTGDTGVSGRSQEGYGVYGFSINGTYGFYTPDDLYVGGSCTGCAISYISFNSSEVSLKPGDIVRAAGVELVKGMATPVMKVAPASAGDAVLGVVLGAAETFQVEPGTNDAQPGLHFGSVGGQAAPGDYLVIVVQGPAQVRAADASIKAGDLVYRGDSGIRTEAIDASIGMALEGVDADGMVWVLVGFH